MMTNADSRVKIARLQKEIAEYLGMAPENLLFEYSQVEGKIRLDLVTVNPRHNQSFLFRTEMGVDQMEALQKVYDYIKDTRAQESTFTVQWLSRNDRELHTSYFRAKNMYEVLDKLYYGRDINTITVYAITLNPIS